MIGQVFNRLKLLYAKGIATLIGADQLQVRVLDGEPLDNIDRVEPYGFSYRPLPGCQPHLIFPAGDRSYGVAILVADKRYQMTLEAGEVALHDEAGNYVAIRRGGVIEVRAAAKVLADTPLFETTGDALVGGNLLVKGKTSSAGGYYGDGGGVAEASGGLKVTGTLTANGKDVSDSHTHPVVGNETLGVN
jgi:phage gp45-like